MMLNGSRKMIARIGGADRDRTDDLLSAIQALSQTELQPHAVFLEGIAFNCLLRREIPGSADYRGGGGWGQGSA